MYNVALQITTQLCILLVLYLVYTALSFSYIAKFPPKCNNIYYNSKSATMMFCLLLLMCTICNNGGDYYTYRNWFIHTYGETAETDEWIEPIYYWIRAIIPSSYFIFRFVIWGTGIFIYKKICEKVGVNLLLSYILFGVFYTFAYSYARASLGIMVTCYAFILLFTSSTKSKRNYIKVILLFALATLLHKSCLSLIFILLSSLLLKLNKKTLIVLAILFIPLSTILNSNLASIGMNIGLSEVQSERYLNTENEAVDRISEIGKYIPILILLFISIAKSFNYKKELPHHIERIVMGTIVIIYVSTLLTTISVSQVQTIAIRYYLMAFVFGLICCTYTIQYLVVNKKILYLLMVYNALHSFAIIYIIIKYGAPGLLERYYN